NELAGSQQWNMGDSGAGTVNSGGAGSSSITYTYAASGPYTVTLTITGLDGVTTDFATTPVTIP
ncbi:MAG TPA: PKD domain-containing protein, partial [Candidatus Limnocylindrales bacterium]|nr:PKD domain-containing protein [Candidatus Limnocylindrales bacterium]